MNAQQPHGSNDGEIKRQCTATSKRSGERCRKPAMKGRTVCRAHGGATPRGIASPHFRHGRWSKDLPAQLAVRYDEALSDPELLSLRDEVALVDAQISTVLETPGDASPWKELGRLVEQRRRLTETEVRHQVLAGQMLALNEALAFAAALAAAVRKNVHDPAVREAIQREMEQLVGTTNQETP